MKKENEKRKKKKEKEKASPPQQTNKQTEISTNQVQKKFLVIFPF